MIHKSTYVLVIAGVFVTPVANSTSTTQNLDVTLNVAASCSLSVDPLDFGSHIIGETNITAQTNATVTCTYGTPYILSAEAINVHTYQMVNASGTAGMNTIPYSLYRDNAGAQVLATDEPTDLDVSFSNTTGTGVAQVYPVYGKLDESTLSKVSAGVYTDTVTLQLTY